MSIRYSFKTRKRLEPSLDAYMLTLAGNSRLLNVGGMKSERCILVSHSTPLTFDYLDLKCLIWVFFFSDYASFHQATLDINSIIDHYEE